MTASLVDIPKLSEQAVSEASGGKRIHCCSLLKSKENGAGENKGNIVSFSHLDFAEKRTLFQWSFDKHNSLEILLPH